MGVQSRMLVGQAEEQEFKGLGQAGSEQGSSLGWICNRVLRQNAGPLGAAKSCVEEASQNTGLLPGTGRHPGLLCTEMQVYCL